MRNGGQLPCPLIDQAVVRASYGVRRCVGWSILTRFVVWWTRDQLLRSLGTHLDVTKKSRPLRVENSGPLSSQNMILGVFEMPDWWYLMWYSQFCPWRLSKNRPLSHAPLSSSHTHCAATAHWRGVSGPVTTTPTCALESGVSSRLCVWVWRVEHAKTLRLHERIPRARSLLRLRSVAAFQAAGHSVMRFFP